MSIRIVLRIPILDRLLRRITEMQKRQAPGTLFVLDTFHITQRVRPGVLFGAASRCCDQVLHELGYRTVLLEVPDPVLLERVIVRRRDTGFARYASKFDSSESEIGDYFVHEQARIREVVTVESRLPCLYLSGTDAPRAVAEAAFAFANSQPGRQAWAWPQSRQVCCWAGRALSPRFTPGGGHL
jgi:hypothetical protein